ncbi:MAG: hypothetical protein HOP21_07460 [Methylotenera sp.]|nr:hypothetical protein [Methylotenera sp.]
MPRNQVKILHKIKLLVSVSNVEEAKIAVENGADIIDLKNPSAGALGALPIAVIDEVVAYLHHQEVKQLTSATIGDIPMSAICIMPKINSLLATKVDFIKIGFFESEDYQATLDMLQEVTQAGAKLVAVLFAEFSYSDALLAAIHKAGFRGIMLDTARKNGLSLLDYYTTDACYTLAKKVKELGMDFGLAGSIKMENIESLRFIKPSYMGFRGGICVNHQRNNQLDSEKISAIRKVL